MNTQDYKNAARELRTFNKMIIVRNAMHGFDLKKYFEMSIIDLVIGSVELTEMMKKTLKNG